MSASFIAPLKNQKRRAYLAFDVSVGDPKWDYQSDQPTLSASYTNPRLYLDPYLQMLHHEFGSAAIGVASAAQAAQPASQTGDAVVSATEMELPRDLLLYKFAPTQFTDEYFVQSTKRQIDQDRAAWSADAQSSASHMFVFSESEIEGRVTDFAAQELWPKYKQHISALAAKVPDLFGFSESIKLSVVEYENGHLIRKKVNSGDGTFLLRPYTEPEWEKVKLPPQGAREITKVPSLSATLAVPGIPAALADRSNIVTRSKSSYLALDRNPTIPPLAIPAADAERMWVKPECNSNVNTFDNTEWENAIQACYAAMKSYSGAISVQYDIVIEGVDVHDRFYIFKAKLLGAEVRGPRGELIASPWAFGFQRRRRYLAKRTGTNCS